MQLFTMISECKRKKTQHEYTACRKNQLFECKRKVDFSDKQRSVIYTSDERCVDEANRWKHGTEIKNREKRLCSRGGIASYKAKQMNKNTEMFT